MARPPRNIKPYVRRFCDKIVPGGTPFYVPVLPVPGAQIQDCFDAVSEYVAGNFGEQVIGWAIWEWRRVLIEAEFHATWRHPVGRLVDITPKMPRIPRILFLPDPDRRYEGRQVENIQQALRRDPAIERYLKRAHLIFLERNKGDLAEQHGEIPVSEKLRRYQAEQERLADFLQKRFGEVTPEAFTKRTTNATGLPEP